jgi:Ca2+-binding EF-hand superfamily protein
MLKKYDADGSGNLDSNELTQLLAHHDHGMKSDWNEYHTGMVVQNVGSVAPTSEEIAWLLEASKKNKQTHVEVSEIGFILDLWHSYVMNRAKLEQTFEKFDTDHNHQLEFDQLKNYLTELNQGQPPKVMRHKHKISSPPPPPTSLSAPAHK